MKVDICWQEMEYFCSNFWSTPKILASITKIEFRFLGQLLKGEGTFVESSKEFKNNHKSHIYTKVWLPSFKMK